MARLIDGRSMQISPLNLPRLPPSPTLLHPRLNPTADDASHVIGVRLLVHPTRLNLASRISKVLGSTILDAA
jgi:hypothetical protein